MTEAERKELVYALWILFVVMTLLVVTTKAGCQTAAFSSHADTLLMERRNVGGYDVRDVVSFTVTNDGTRDLLISFRSVSDEQDFEVTGILGRIPPHEQRRIDVRPARSVWHDTSCLIVLESNDPTGVHYLAVHGRASVMDGISETKDRTFSRTIWRDVVGRIADTTVNGMYFSQGKRKVVLK